MTQRVRVRNSGTDVRNVPCEMPFLESDIYTLETMMKQWNDAETQEQFGMRLTSDLVQFFQLDGCVLISTFPVEKRIVGQAGRSVDWQSDVDGTLVFPLVVFERSVGTIYVAVDDERWSQSRKSLLLSTIIHHAGMCLSNLQLILQLEVQQHQMRIGLINERMRISSDLHDGPLQLLFHLMRFTETNNESGISSNQLYQVKEICLQVSEELRTICQNLRPQRLQRMEIAEAISYLVEQANQISKNTTYSLQIAPSFPPHLGDEVEILIYRAVQELLFNAYKHADASQVNVLLMMKEEDSFLQVKVQDDGKGISKFDEWDQWLANGNLGLIGLRGRVENVGGELRISTFNGAGTCVIIQIPVGRGE